MVYSFVYLRTTFSKDGSLESEIRISKANTAFGKLQTSIHGITKNSKLDLYTVCVITVLLKKYKANNDNYMHRILNIKGSFCTLDTLVCERVCSMNIEERIILNMMHWAGHFKIDDGRPLKHILWGVYWKKEAKA